MAAFVAEFLAKNGTESDAMTILRLSDKSWRNNDYLIPRALALSENPPEFVLDNSLSTSTRARIIRLLSNEGILALRSEWLALLSSDSADIRKGMVLRIFSVTSGGERKKLISQLHSKSTYYYDVVHWLDRLSYSAKKWQAAFAESLSKNLDRPYKSDWLRD